MKKQVDTLNAQLSESQATLDHNRAVLTQAELNLGYTVLRAPVDGAVGSRTVRVGLYVQPGMLLLAVVPLQATYVVANYKETQLADVRPGQPVSIDVDTFAGTSVHGIVDSIAPASGQEFALLPPDNATGNFTKIVQRIPVKIAIDRTDPLAGRLLPGMSVTATIKIGLALGSSPPSPPRNRSARATSMASIEMTGVHEPEGASLRAWISVFGCMVGALIAVLDIQITNSSLPEIEGGIGTGIDNGTWISTSYLIGEIIMIPLTDYLSRVFSFRRFLLGNLCLFLIFSMGCAFATSLGEMIILRGLQGFTAGVMIPMAFTRVLTTLPPHQQPAGLAAFALTATFGPSIGPTIGGYLTEQYGWQYIFFINLIPGALMLGLLYSTLERGKMKLGLLREGDWLGIAFMTVGLASLQTVLDEGNQDDWFGSPYIVHLSILAAVALTIFVIVELVVDKPAVQLRLLARRNFAFGTVANVMVGFALFGSVYVLPAYLSEVQGYNAEQTGLVLAWVGLPQLLIIPFVPLLQKHFDPRALVCVGLAIFAASCFMNTHLSFDDSGDQLIMTNIVRAIGQAVVIAPLVGIAMNGIPKELSGAASGVFNMVRSLGGAVGTATLATVVSKREQFHSNIIGQSVTPYGNSVEQFLSSMQQYFLAHGAGDAASAHHQAEILLGKLVAQQSLVMAFSDTFYVLGVLLLLAGIAVLLTRRPSPA